MAIQAIIDERRDPNADTCISVVVLPVMLKEVDSKTRGNDDDCQLFILPRDMASWIWPETTMHLATNWAEKLWYPVVMEIVSDWSREDYDEYEKEVYLSGGTIDRKKRYYIE